MTLGLMTFKIYAVATQFQYGTVLGNQGYSKLHALSYMQRMHNWYKRACILGLETIYAPHHPDVFGVKRPLIHDIMFDFEDIQNMFHLKQLGVKIVQLWCI